MRTGFPPPWPNALSKAGFRLSAAALAMLFSGLLGPAANAKDGPRLTVVELFHSQGCSSCPPAEANVMALSNRPDLLTLSFGVTYWDSLGWRDTFGSSAFTQRQWDYAKAFGRREVATPQVVVNGRGDVVGDRREAIDALIRQLGDMGQGPRIEVKSGKIVIGEGAPTRARVILVRFDPRTVLVPIRAGENEGRTLPQKDVVKSLVDLGPWTGHPARFDLPRLDQPGLKSAVLVQAGAGGPILSAAKIS